MILTDNATEIILALVAIFGTCLNLVLTAILHAIQKKNTARIEEVEANKGPATEDVIQLYTTAERSLEAINKLLRKHGRSVQARAEKLSTLGLEEETPPPPPPSRKRGGLRRVRQKTSPKQEQTSLDDFNQ